MSFKFNLQEFTTITTYIVDVTKTLGTVPNNSAAGIFNWNLCKFIIWYQTTEKYVPKH